MVIKKLTRIGNSQGITLDKAILEALAIQPGDQLQLTITGGVLTITPVNLGLGKDRVKASIKKLRPRYDKMLRNLAK